jgi:hypothetical protein
VRTRRLLLFLLPALAAAAAPAVAQAGAWNDARAMELVRRAQERRAVTLADTGLVDYQADARGYVYFYLDRRDVDQRTLVKTDQVALEVLWKAPNLSRQRIVGLRDEKTLPTSIRYHQDHLTVVQDNFGDRIRLGDGDEVRDVTHPAAPASDEVYDYRLADSSSVRLPGAGGQVQVYRLEVRPKDLSRPGLVGSIYVDRRAGDIVRMAFTFTPPSYVDRQLDYINVSLENGLWKGRFWLPDRQEVEIRRQLPELGFPAGGMIRGTMRISNYRFNQDLSPALFRGPKVVSVPEAQRRAFAFEQGLYEELREEGLGPQVELGEVRREAMRLVGARLLSGLPALRADVPEVSNVLRYDRAEGAVLGFGTRAQPSAQVDVEASGGWAFGAEHAIGRAAVLWTRPRFRLGLEGVYNAPRDVGVGPVASGVMNTLSAVLAGNDYTDLHYARGAEIRADAGAGRGWTADVALRGEVQRSARQEADVSVFGGDDAFRPVNAVDDGTMWRGALALSRSTPSGAARGWSARVTAAGGVLDGEDGETRRFARPTVELGWVRRWVPADAALEVDLSGGAAFGDLPRQELFLLGGRGTVPGFDFRSCGGDRFALARATASADLVRPWVRGRLLAASGWAGVGAAGDEALAAWGTAGTTRRPRASVGAGVGLIFDILRVDVHHGLGPGARWEVVVEASPSFWDFL